jgi:UDP-sulfoquinovose synthase
MRIAILGGDGYLGWPTAMSLAALGHDVYVMDNYLRRTLARETASEALFPTPLLPERAERFAAVSGYRVHATIGDCTNFDDMAGFFTAAKPDAVVHYAEQPSGPYSMIGRREAALTLDNNLRATFNTIWAVLECAPGAHIVKLGTMGEYGTPNIEIEEGWIDIEHKGRAEKFLYPRAAGSLYHTTKVLDTDLLWFYVRLYGLRVTDLMQGPVYGLETPETLLDDAFLPHFHYDDIFGTVLNRFVAQAVAGLPLTVYGRGGQTRGYLNLTDTLQCVNLALMNPPGPGNLRILNQFTEVFSVNDLADRVRLAGRHCSLNVEVRNIDNPRVEKEEHFYQPAHTGLAELGLVPRFLSDDVLVTMLRKVAAYRTLIDPAKIAPRVRWSTP